MIANEGGIKHRSDPISYVCAASLASGTAIASRRADGAPPDRGKGGTASDGERESGGTKSPG
jgi:hypothetical protein